MASWISQYCLSCDKQVFVDSDAYCSESCRLADLERSPYSPTSSETAFAGTASTSWSSNPSARSSSSSSASASGNKFYLSPAYDFTNAKPYGTTPPRASFLDSYSLTRPQQPASSTRAHVLTPSSSHSSLSSMRSTSTSDEASQLSEKARKELQAYAFSFEQVRLQRRRSY